MNKKKHTKQTFMTCLWKCDTSLIKDWAGLGASWRHCYPGGEGCLYVVVNEHFPLLEAYGGGGSDSSSPELCRTRLMSIFVSLLINILNDYIKINLFFKKYKYPSLWGSHQRKIMLCHPVQLQKCGRNTLFLVVKFPGLK
jgi:hypothetical protein